MPSPRVHPVTITFAGQDVQPPVFVAGSFTQPPWHPVLMETKKSEHAPKGFELNRVFTKAFEVPEGEWQYKFKLGYGQWWVCDPRSETVDDGHGNYNNLLLVCSEGGTTREDLLMAKHADYSAYPKTAIDRHVDDMPEVDEDYYGETPLMPHEEPSLMTKSGLEVDPGQKGRRTSLGFSISRVHTFVPPEPTEDDLKDPELEKFPDNRAAILNRIDTLKYELPIDNY